MIPDHFSTLRKVILACMILVPLIPFMLALAIGYYYFKASLEDSTVASMKRIVHDHRQMIESFLKEREHDLNFVLNSYTYEDLSQSERLETVFHNLQKDSHTFVDLGVFNQAGVHIAYHGPFDLRARVYKNANWFKEVMKQGYYISDIFLGYRRIPHFIIAVTKKAAGKKWVLRTTIDTVTFNNIVKSVRIGKTGEAYILNANGLLQTEPRSGGKLMDKCPDNIHYPLSDTHIKTYINKDVKGEEYLYATTWMQDKKWLLIARQRKSDAFNALSSAVYLVVFIVVAGSTAILCVAFYLTNRIVRQMKKMNDEKDRLNQQLIGASRLVELGEMSAGFAHEINNPLQIVKSEQALVEMIIEEMKEKGRIKESESLAEIKDSMDQIKLQISRCAEITQSVLKFGRQNEPKSQDIDLRKFIPEIIGMVAQKAIVHGISIEQHIAENTCPVHGDSTQLQQVILNLFNNAMDAMLEKHGTSGGKIIVNAGPSENNTVEILVKDNGCGIMPENLNRIFTPFFTTKPVGKGAGLGLSVCYGIIINMRGTMEVTSEIGAGTTFTILLPAVV
jgi:two-component system, NtrC family, sensor kinase